MTQKSSTTTTTSTELAILEDFNNQEVAEITEENAEALYHQEVNKDKKSFPTLPTLRIVHQAVDDDGNPLVDSNGKTVKAGSWNVKGTDLYQKDIMFIPLLDYFQVQKGYTDHSGNYKVISSILFKNFKEEILSTDGTLACGRVDKNGEFLTSKKLNQLYSEEEMESIKKSTPVVVQQMGLAFFEEGPEEGIPVIFYLKKMNIKTVIDSFKQVKNPESRFFTFSTKREKVGSVIYYSPVVEVDTETLPSPKNFKTMLKARNYFFDYVEAFNTYVINKYKQAISDNTADPQYEDTEELDEAADVLLKKDKVKDVDYEEVGVLPEEEDDDLPY